MNHAYSTYTQALACFGESANSDRLKHERLPFRLQIMNVGGTAIVFYQAQVAGSKKHSRPAAVPNKPLPNGRAPPGWRSGGKTCVERARGAAVQSMPDSGD